MKVQKGIVFLAQQQGNRFRRRLLLTCGGGEGAWANENRGSSWLGLDLIKGLSFWLGPPLHVAALSIGCNVCQCLSSLVPHVWQCEVWLLKLPHEQHRYICLLFRRMLCCWAHRLKDFSIERRGKTMIKATTPHSKTMQIIRMNIASANLSCVCQSARQSASQAAKATQPEAELANARQRVSQPARKPARQTASQPVSQSASHPASKPASQPASLPARLGFQFC